MNPQLYSIVFTAAASIIIYKLLSTFHYNCESIYDTKEHISIQNVQDWAYRRFKIVKKITTIYAFTAMLKKYIEHGIQNSS